MQYNIRNSMFNDRL